MSEEPKANNSYLNILHECSTRLRKGHDQRDDRDVTRALRRLPILRQTCQPAILQACWLATNPSDRDNAAPLFSLLANLENLWPPQPDPAAPPTNTSGADNQSQAGTSADKPAAKTSADKPAAKTSADKPAAKTSADKPAASVTAPDATPDATADATPDAAPPTAAERLKNLTEQLSNTQPETLLTIRLWLSICICFLAVDSYAKTITSYPQQSQEILNLGVQVANSIKEQIRAIEKSFDALDAKAYFAMSRIMTLAGRGVELRPFFLEEYRTAALKSKELCQATLINLLLQNYIDKSEPDLAIKFVLKTYFPEHIRSTTQLVRCLFNLGRIQATRLEYSDAHEKLMTSVRKLPPDENFAPGFKLLAWKHAVIVELLMGDVPDVGIFRQKSMQGKLMAYEGIVQAVRRGDLTDFGRVLDTYREEFQQDGTLFLVDRLHHSVIKAGLRRINNSYSRIPLDNIAKMLGINSVTDAEGIVAKAILDGVVTGIIDAETRCLISKESTDRYKTREPAEIFNKRIQFCSAMYKEAVKACI